MAMKTATERLRRVIPHASDCACMGCHADGRYETYCGPFCEHTPFQVSLALSDVLRYEIGQQRRLQGENAAEAEFQALKARLVTVILDAEWPEVQR